MTETSERLKAQIANLRSQVEIVIERVQEAGADLREQIEGRLLEVVETLDDIVADIAEDRVDGDEDENGGKNA